MSVKSCRASVLTGVAVVALLATQAISTTAVGNAPTGTLEGAKLENYIAKDLSRGLPAVPVEVTCPANVLVEKGRWSTCTASVDGQKLLYRITHTSGRGDLLFKRTKAVIDLNRVQSLVARQVAQQMGGKWRIKCSVAGASRIYVVAVNRSFTCPIDGKDGEGVSRQGNIVYHVENLRGDIDWEAR